MVRVLFVCLGNICRSPMAEAVFRHHVQRAGLEQFIEIDSAAIGSWHVGNPPHEGTQLVLTKHNIRFDTIVARQIHSADFQQFDYIVCMDDSNVEKLRAFAPDAKNVTKLMDYASAYKETEVEDPYFTGRFDYVYELVEAGSIGLINHIRNKYHLS
ncbi:low molecular weight protein-tyrosine-phosphatase yfkJ [Brevibacillus laterosporus GI-9]|uniref:low molecular weight protein-tyrosine-phosphatase n=1 Tax=Brevibacillus laterosporus TaxID=1465 RepID=UPI0002404AFA|nr:low molecular weight protein-tyrosine-phosphatase [Brevibacillus laterosporus]CCF13493.1 low molecular weight protein-tyrosine-phosphatase yfkJ [Brevibacillus laterosporus GI-9]